MSTTTTRAHLRRPAAPRHISGRHLQNDQQRWQAYEAAKHLWEAQNPGATSAEYEAAMQQLARKAGV